MKKKEGDQVTLLTCPAGSGSEVRIQLYALASAVSSASKDDRNSSTTGPKGNGTLRDACDSTSEQGVSWNVFAPRPINSQISVGVQPDHPCENNGSRDQE